MSALARQESDLKADRAKLQEELEARFGAQLSQALAGKTTGTATVELQDRFKVRRETKKEVDWDSDILFGVASTLPSWDRVKALFKVEFSMSETVYKALGGADPALKAAVDKARTVTPKPGKVELIAPEAAA